MHSPGLENFSKRLHNVCDIYQSYCYKAVEILVLRKHPWNQAGRILSLNMNLMMDSFNILSHLLITDTRYDIYYYLHLATKDSNSGLESRFSCLPSMFPWENI